MSSRPTSPWLSKGFAAFPRGLTRLLSGGHVLRRVGKLAASLVLALVAAPWLDRLPSRETGGADELTRVPHTIRECPAPLSV